MKKTNRGTEASNENTAAFFAPKQSAAKPPSALPAMAPIDGSKTRSVVLCQVMGRIIPAYARMAMEVQQAMII